MPEIKEYSNVVDYMHEIGFASFGGMEPAPLSFQEIQAWQSLTGVALSSFEASLMRILSTEFVSQSAQKDADDIPMMLEEALRDKNSPFHDEAKKEITKIAKAKLRGN